MIGAAAGDFPPGKWSHVLIGGQWPSSSTLEMLGSAMQERGTTATTYNDHADQLSNALTGPLANQQGVTAEAAQQSFKAGRDHSQAVAEKNTTKSNAYSKAYQAVSALRGELQQIAHDGNENIDKIVSSKIDPATKLGLVVQAVIDGQTQAGQKAGEKAQDISQGIQEILRQEGIDMSARDFMKSQGFDLSGAFGSPNEQSVRDQVQALMDGPKQAPAPSESTGVSGESMSRYAQNGAGPDTSPAAGGAGASPASGGGIQNVGFNQEGPIQQAPSAAQSVTRTDSVFGVGQNTYSPGALPTQAGAPRVSTPSLTPATGGVTSTLPSTGLSTGGMGTGGLGVLTTDVKYGVAW